MRRCGSGVAGLLFGGLIFLAVTVLLLAAGCTNPMLQTVEAVVRQFSTATYEVNFHDRAGIASDSVIVITFSESMDTDTFVLGGSMAAESDGGKWSEDEWPSDTLTIRPSMTWPEGGGQTLTVEVDDLETYPAELISLSYGVLDGVVYVHPDGDDSNYGTHDLPKASIEAAVEDAQAAYERSEVRVASGTYELSGVVTINTDLKLLGGYSTTDWGVRQSDPDWALAETPAPEYPTEIRNPSMGSSSTISIYQASGSPLVEGFTLSGPLRADTNVVQVFDCTATIRSCDIQATRFDGSVGVVGYVADLLVEKCRMDGGSVDHSTAVFAYQTTLEIEDCTVSGGNGDQTCALWLIESIGSVHGSRIHGGSGRTDAMGLYVADDSDVAIRNNLINAGSGTSTYGLWIKNADPVIQNNIIHGGGASIFSDSIADGMYLLAGANPVVENNIITTESGTNQYAISVGDISSRPASLRNNCIHDWGGLSYAYMDLDADITHATGTDMNALEFASGNVSDDPSLDWVGEWNFTGTPSAAVTEGGINLSTEWGGATDILGFARTDPWSMGAYEY